LAEEVSEAEARQIVDDLKKEMEEIRKVRKQTMLSVEELLQPKDTSLFKYRAAPSFTFSQTHYTESWQDGVNSIGFRAAFFGYGFYARKNFFIRFAPDMAYSRANEKDESIKKEDRLALNLSAGRRLLPKYHIFLTGQIDLKTQFDKGEGQLVTDKKGTVSKFFSPAYIVGSLGLRHNMPFGLKITASPVSGRFTFVTDTSLSRYVSGMYKDDKALSFKSELGAYVEFSFERKFFNNLLIISKLELFSNYQDNPQNIDVDWSTTIDLKISKWFSLVIYNRVVYRDKSRYYVTDPDTQTSILRGPSIQWNESVNAGISYTFER
jgi:hypothetical protein